MCMETSLTRAHIQTHFRTRFPFTNTKPISLIYVHFAIPNWANIPGKIVLFSGNIGFPIKVFFILIIFRSHKKWQQVADLYQYLSIKVVKNIYNVYA